MQATCPNCHTRPADTLVHYDELVKRSYQRTSRQSTRGRVTVRSYSSTSDRGDATLCSVCAARYLSPHSAVGRARFWRFLVA
jgi:hypothetical protein